MSPFSALKPYTIPCEACGAPVARRCHAESGLELTAPHWRRVWRAALNLAPGLRFSPLSGQCFLIGDPGGPDGLFFGRLERPDPAGPWFAYGPDGLQLDSGDQDDLPKLCALLVRVALPAATAESSQQAESIP